MSRVHDINENVARAETAAGLYAVLVRIFHSSVVQIVDSDCKIIRFLRFTFFRSLLAQALCFAEIMSVEGGAEHRSGQVIGVVELEGHVAVGMQQGRVAHTHGDVSVAEGDVRTAQGVQTRRGGQAHE